MYFVQDHNTKQVLSIHNETPGGLERAVREADMRTHARQTPYEVVDAGHRRLHLSYPLEARNRLHKRFVEQLHSLRPTFYVVAYLLFIGLMLYLRR